MAHPFNYHDLKAHLLDKMNESEKVFVRKDGGIHDRSTTAGASELSGCIRAVLFSKNGTKKDSGYRDSRGYALRGDTLENHFVVPLLRSVADALGAELRFAGDEQRTLVSGRLSATPDAILILPDGRVINIEIKTFDPRANIPLSGKSNHRIQNQIQMGLLREEGFDVDQTWLIYLNCSNFEDIRIVEVDFDPEAFVYMKVRAEQAFTAAPHEVPAEGAMTDECKYCAYTEACGQAVRNSMPSQKNPDLPVSQVATLEELVSKLREHDVIQTESKRLVTEVKEALKIFLRENDVKNYRGDDYEVSYSTVAGRESLDRKALEAAGIELSPYLKRSDDSDRLTVKFS